MTDSRSTEQAPTKERGGAKTIEMGTWFEFFDNPIPSADNEIIETADIAQNRELIGGLIGRMFTPSGRKISGTEGIHVKFTIRKKPDVVNTQPGINREYDPHGTRFATPVIYLALGSGQIFASLGKQEEQSRITFTDWSQVPQEDKNAVKKNVQNHKAQPKPFRLHELIEAKYKIT